MFNKGIERNETGEARRNRIFKNIYNHAQEFKLHLANFESLLKRMLGWVGLGVGVGKRCDQACISNVLLWCYHKKVI